MIDIFQDILKNKDRWLQSKKGSDFEERFQEALKKNGYNRLQIQDHKEMLDAFKDEVLDKQSDDFIANNLNGMHLKHAFICQPYGSQNYPDFLVFTPHYIIPIEIKYSSEKAVKPMWNSNLPKFNGFYIFGSYSQKDVTFFSGRHVLGSNERDELIDFFEKQIKPLEEAFKEKMKQKTKDGVYSFKRGFNVYVRRAFEQNKVCNEDAEIDYFRASDRKDIEQSVLTLLEKLSQ